MSGIEFDITEKALLYEGTEESKKVYFCGWVAVQTDMPEILIKTDFGQVLDTSLEMFPQEEVKQELREENKSFKTVLGFRATTVLSDIKYNDISIWINGIKSYRIKKKQLKKLYEKYIMMLNAEEWRRHDEETVIRGWGFHKYLPFEVKVFDIDGSELKADIIMQRRVDIERNFYIENTEKRSFGFVITIKNSDIKSDNIKLILSSADREKVETIDISKSRKRQAENETLRSKLLSTEKWIRGLGYLKRKGVKAFARKLAKINDTPESEYQRWFMAHRVTVEELERQRNTDFKLCPKISIVIPLYNTKFPFLKAIMDSVVNQSYGNWELCLADGSTDNSVGGYISDNYNDKRIIYKRLEKNEGIAGNTNAALAMATGDFIALCDHDDILEPDALFEIVKYYNENPDTDIIYTDEDLTDETGKKFSSPRFKPDYNPDLLNSINYICHIFAVKKNIMDEVGGFRKEYDGAQDWDMILRCCEKSENIGHIPRILYHWRAYEESTAGNTDSKEYAIEAGRRAVADHLKRIGLNGELEYTDVFVLFRVKLIPKGHPLISIIIPNKDEKDTLKKCVESIEAKSTYDNYEIIIVENNSENDETFEFYKELENKYSNIRVVYYEGGFNYSKINNFGVGYAKGEYYILLNNDTEVITPDWMECMLGYCERENTGIVGAKLYYPDDTVQHCGAVIGIGGFAGHILTQTTPEDAGYLGRLKAVADMSAVTAAALMVKKSVFDEVGGLDEDFTVALNDMDFCLKVRSLGKLIVLDPGVNLYHYESKSRGFENTPEQHERFKVEIKRFRDKWQDIIDKGDPYYSPNLTLMYGDCRIRGVDEHFDIIDEIYE